MRFFDWLLLRMPADTESGWVVYAAAAAVLLWQLRWLLGHCLAASYVRRILLWAAAVILLLPMRQPIGEDIFALPALTTFAIALLGGESALALRAGTILLAALAAVLCLAAGAMILQARRRRTRRGAVA